jgi:pimeloyl-ACP methyl ester carboxylesterase
MATKEPVAETPSARQERQLLASRARPAAPWEARNADQDYGASAEPSWREIDWPAHLHDVEIERRQVNYVDIGEGAPPPVVFVPGLAGQWQNWLENIPRVAETRRVVALDLPGFGQSELPRERISIPGYGRCVEALCDALGLERAALVGNSMGGFVASEVAIQFPERVERLALVSAAGITSSNVRRRPALTVGRVAAALAAYTAAQHRHMARRPRARHLALALVARHPSRLSADVAWEALMKGAGKPGFDDALRACLEYDFREHLPEIRCQALIVWGEKDSVLPAEDAHEFEQLVPHSRKVVMSDTGHVPQLERPAAFNDLLLEFLDEQGG